MGLAAVLDLIEVNKDNVVFIVMEEWSSQFITGPPCCLKVFLGALRQCIEVRHRPAALHPLDDTIPTACRFYA
jgi:hypothetical protein